MTVEISTLDGLDAIPVADGFVWRPIRRRFDIRGFGVNAYTSEGVGRQIVEEHTESRLEHEEMYMVVRGRATFTVDGDAFDAPRGTIVFLRDPSLRRGAVAEEEGTVVLAVGGKPGAPFEVSAWESMFAAIPHTRAERWDDAIAIVGDALREHPNHPALLYDLACIEARAGRRLDALLHLQESVRRDPSFRAHARRDTDFAAIRSEPGFPA
jgi:quercetin dioxygenase-like cupin family protein